MNPSSAAEEVERRLAASREALLATLQNVAPDDQDRALKPGAWTIRQQIDHLERSERAFLILVRIIRIKGIFRRGAEAGPPTLDFTYAGTSIGTPWLVRPHGTRSLEALLDRGKRTRRRTLKILRRLALSSERGSTVAHPAFGRLDAIQWIAVAALHERHHVEQIRAINASRE